MFCFIFVQLLSKDEKRGDYQNFFYSYRNSTQTLRVYNNLNTLLNQLSYIL